ncbi:undecaprenyl-diphosphate phosphatase [Texcoconibacillus texcoconensis]|uniref:Undecaprenyl-diphosphatase n=1 Tax=Texcoconibacillus texcoconensis TaxID=1095777 RepID=A0A840QNT2_9BACI|nr:undecaprenyl-diphosphate phosphatase [Texcoconibacillus texcoconensis]MBB5172997.1 undecaprenyl-diphosphatase [Texcoconibacillus texcoconensis]
MSIIEAIIFGIVQGLTEFLPVSSTAHIVITQLLFGYTFPGLSFEIFLHFASILAVILYFHKDIWNVVAGFIKYITTRDHHYRVSFFFALYIIGATFITGILGMLLSDMIADTMKTPQMIAGALTVTGIALIVIERFHSYGSRRTEDMSFIDAIIVGLGQTLAVIPGISRSGATLVVALLAGLDRETAVRYSFLLAIPVILGSSVLTFDDMSTGFFQEVGIIPLALSFIVTVVFSWIGIVWLISFLKKSRLVYFAIYCFILAVCVYLFIEPITIMELEES